MSLTSFPCLLMRGGTSRAPYFRASDLPSNRDEIAQLLIAAMGAGSPLQVDGIGGGQPTTSKVAILSRSDHEWASIDYLFAQVHAEKAEVDFSPTCGNILSGVGPAAIELGLHEIDGATTAVKIHGVNTGALVESVVETPDGVVNYAGQAKIDGVPGTAAPVLLNFKDVTGSKTGALFPTGNPKDTIDGIDVTCIDVAMPMVIARAAAFGVTGYESREEMDQNDSLFAAMEPIRLKAGQLMGLGDVSGSVVPKFGLVSAPRDGGAINARYFMPWRCHPSYAVTGSICTSSCAMAPGTVAEGIVALPSESPTPLKIEHPSGSIDVVMDVDQSNGQFKLINAGLLRTARRLFMGEVSVPDDVLSVDVLR